MGVIFIPLNKSLDGAMFVSEVGLNVSRRLRRNDYYQVVLTHLELQGLSH